MQVSNITANHRDLTGFTKSGQPTAGPAGGKIETLGSRVGSAGRSTEALAEIVSKYDVTEISPSEFTEMIQELYEAGAISEDELQQLTAIRHDLETAAVAPDESIDLLEFYTEQIERVQRRTDDSDGPPGEHEQVGPLLRRLDWIEKFALVQSAPETVGLDVMA
ncbi:MAG: hypothetical protein A2V70_08585 [Planctomycetes bacterium RBG_13_63_9]|nr:MAG: hypothetical protein A2V70_08585 [Planctomycetes bacterium RBG_13_63_9]